MLPEQMAVRIKWTLLDAGIPVCAVSVTAPRRDGVRVEYKPNTTPAQKVLADQMVAIFDWSEEAHAKWAEAREREAAAGRSIGLDEVALLMEEINVLRAALGMAPRPPGFIQAMRG